jgi:hypothetical protein
VGDSRADKDGEAEAEHEVEKLDGEIERVIQYYVNRGLIDEGYYTEDLIKDIMDVIRQTGDVTLNSEGLMDCKHNEIEICGHPLDSVAIIITEGKLGKEYEKDIEINGWCNLCGAVNTINGWKSPIHAQSKPTAKGLGRDLVAQCNFIKQNPAGQCNSKNCVWDIDGHRFVCEDLTVVKSDDPHIEKSEVIEIIKRCEASGEMKFGDNEGSFVSGVYEMAMFIIGKGDKPDV